MEGKDHAQDHDGTSGSQSTIDGSESQKAGVDKGKGKEKSKEASVVGRLQSSGKLVVNALTTSHYVANIPPGSKTMGSSSRIEQSSIMPGESSSQIAHQPEPSGTLRTATDARDSSEDFNTFITGPRDSLSKETFNFQAPNKTVAEQEALDGSAVVELLSLPDDPVDMLERQEEHDFLTLEEAERLREALFKPTESQPHWEKLLDFTPDFIVNPEASHEAALHLGTTDAAAARGLWLQQWSDVLAAYNSQVWGDLEPLVREARVEVDLLATQQVASSGAPEAKALERLRQILAHVRG